MVVVCGRNGKDRWFLDGGCVSTAELDRVSGRLTWAEAGSK